MAGSVMWGMMVQDCDGSSRMAGAGGWLVLGQSETLSQKQVNKPGKQNQPKMVPISTGFCLFVFAFMLTEPSGGGIAPIKSLVSPLLLHAFL